MKTASPELIALLAGARQFVMWETFSFTLPDGTQIDYSTRDPDAPPLRQASGGGTVELPGDNDSIATAQPVPALPATIHGTAGGADENDFYAVTLAADRRLLVRLTPPADADFDLILFDADGTALASTENGLGVVEQLSHTVAGAPATLYVCVNGWSGTGPYTLELSDAPITRWLLDSFTGSAGTPLSAHVGEIGTTWTDGHGGYAVGASGFTLNGSGVVRNPVSDSGQVRATGLPPADLADFYLELTCSLGDAASVNFFCVRLDGFEGCYAELAAYGSTVKMSTYSASNGQTISNSWDTGAAYGAGIEHTARIEVTNGRKTVTFRFNGQFITASHLAAPLPPPDATEITLYGPDGVTAVSRIEGGLL